MPNYNPDRYTADGSLWHMTRLALKGDRASAHRLARELARRMPAGDLRENIEGLLRESDIQPSILRTRLEEIMERTRPPLEVFRDGDHFWVERKRRPSD